jgi:hypothetical protein
MYDPLYGQVIAWAGLALLLMLCLPFAGIQKLVLEVYAWALRLALLALLGAAAYLWFRPGDLPVEVTDTLNGFPRLRAILPEPGTQHFGVCAASLSVTVLLPLLAMLDVSRKLAGWRLRRLRALAAEPKVVEAPAPPASRLGPAPVVRRVDRRAAAEALAEVGSRKPSRAANQPE